jgi:hypothetical protein
MPPGERIHSPHQVKESGSPGVRKSLLSASRVNCWSGRSAADRKAPRAEADPFNLAKPARAAPADELARGGGPPSVNPSHDDSGTISGPCGEFRDTITGSTPSNVTTVSPPK